MILSDSKARSDDDPNSSAPSYPDVKRSSPSSPNPNSDSSQEMVAAAVEAEYIAARTARDIDLKIIGPMKRDRSPAAQLARRRLMFRAVFGEFMCTTCVFAPVFLVTCNNHILGWDTTYPLGNSALIAFTLLCSSISSIYCFSDVSGAHFNPAVTFAAWLTGKTSNRKLVLYIVAQCLATVNCMIIVCAVFPNPVPLFNFLIITPPTSDLARLFMMEFFLTWSLVYVAFTVAYEDAEQQKKSSMSFKTVANTDGLTLFATTPQSKSGFAPFAIGFILSALALCGGSVSGGCFNPARLFGPALFSGRFDYIFLYWIAELLGGGAAGLFIKFVHPLGKPMEEMPAGVDIAKVLSTRLSASSEPRVPTQTNGNEKIEAEMVTQN